MSEPSTGGLRAALHDLLRHPIRLRLVLGGGLLALWYAGLYLPLVRSIGEASRRLAAERQQLDLSRQIEELRREARRYRTRLPANDDPSEWAHFLMDGIRQRPLKLVALEPRVDVDVGPYKAVVLSVIAEGTYPDLEQFLRWLETAPRLVRIESLRITPKTGAGAGAAVPTSEMKLTVMGIVGS